MNVEHELESKPLPSTRNSAWNRLTVSIKRKRGGTKCATAESGAKGNFLLDINLFMSGNQSFNQSLYAPLTRAPLVCRPAVYFKRKVYMKRRPILRWILSAGVMVQLAVLLCSAPLHAQSGLVPGMEDPAGGGHGPTTFNDRTPIPEQHVLIADHAPGDVHGVTRYPSGLPMAGAQVVILNADVDVERSTISASDGCYTFKKLKPGHYQMSARIDGYSSAGIINVDVVPGQSVNSDISLKSIRGASALRNSGSGYRPTTGLIMPSLPVYVSQILNLQRIPLLKEPFGQLTRQSPQPPAIRRKLPRPPPASQSPLQSRTNWKPCESALTNLSRN